MKKIFSIIGARPQFIKHAPMQLQLQKHFDAKTIHTGQHYDENMSDIFFTELSIPKPDFLLDIGGSKSQAEQTAIMMIQIERICLEEKPDAILVYGDTNSTLAATLVAVKMHIKLIHIEAGLRSFNRNMPEEVNRIIADQFADLMFCPNKNALNNLSREGINTSNAFVTGDVMCDSIKLVERNIKAPIQVSYYFTTIHRPYNTDNKVRLSRILNVLDGLKEKVVFALHPRTHARMQEFDLNKDSYSNIIFVPPASYIESLSYQKFAEGIITDSGGIQKEAYMLRKKCVTLRSETEWIETLSNGWNTLLFDNLDGLQNVLEESCGIYEPVLFGLGNAAEEITDIIRKRLV